MPKLPYPHCFTVLMALVTTVSAPGEITGGMLPRDFDPPGQPFCYFSHPTDVIGTLYAPVASEITPEGYIYTGFGELMFFVGNPLVPVDQRIRTLRHGFLPCVEYSVEREGVRYEFQLFSASNPSDADHLPLNFARVHVTNLIDEDRTAFVSSGYRFAPHMDTLQYPLYRFSQRFTYIPDELTKGQVPYDPKWKYSMEDGALVRDGRVIYLYPTSPKPWQTSIALGDQGIRKLKFFTGEVDERPPANKHDAHTVMGVATYRILLKKGQSQWLDFTMPLAPLPVDSRAVQGARSTSAGPTLASTMSDWEHLVLPKSPMEFPEPKVEEAMLANTVFSLLAIDKIGDDYLLCDNKFQYSNFYPTDSNLMVAALDDMGQAEIARRTVLYNLRGQNTEGFYDLLRLWKPHTWETKPGLPEGVGYTLWAFKRHFALSGDVAFLHTIYPSVQRAMDWIDRATRSDALGLLPVSTVADDALLKNAHQTGQNFWTLAGIQCATDLASAMNLPDDQNRFRKIGERLHAAVDRQLAKQTALSGGYIPPSLDRTLLGADWDNLHTLYPVPLFDPMDPRVEATIRKTRGEYAEGILTYPLPKAIAETPEGTVFDKVRQLHYWHSTDNAMNQLVRNAPGDQQDVVNDLYALLLHTTSTHATQEFGAVPWSTRDFGLVHNLTPDGSTSAVLIELLRNMLVREQGDDLHLFSAVSPRWIGAKRTVSLRGAPTEFGPIDATLTSDATSLTMEVSSHFRRSPHRLIVHLPWFFSVKEVQLDGQPVPLKDRTVALPPDGGRLVVIGQLQPGTEQGGFDRAVTAYQQEYRARYEAFLRTGETPLPTKP